MNDKHTIRIGFVVIISILILLFNVSKFSFAQAIPEDAPIPEPEPTEDIGPWADAGYDTIYQPGDTVTLFSLSIAPDPHYIVSHLCCQKGSKDW